LSDDGATYGFTYTKEHLVEGSLRRLAQPVTVSGLGSCVPV
jgi:hypothetical protein